MRHRLVCFDAGFTLIRPIRELWEHLGQVLTGHGHAPTETELRAAWEAADRWFWEDYHRDENTAWTNDAAIAEIWRSYHRLMLRELGVADDDGTLIAAILDSQFAPDGWELYPDVLPAMTALAERTPAPLIGIVSDWESTLPPITSRLGLDAYVDFVLASGAVGVAKPSPEFFLLACERARVAPHEAVMVGDSLRADVRGAQSAGMDAVLLERSGRADAPDGVAVIHDLRELMLVLDTFPPGAGAGPMVHSSEG